MLRNLRTWLFGPFFSGSVTPAGDFLTLLQESYAYLRQHRYRVVSTELPDALLKKWLMPMPGGADADEYIREFTCKKDTLSEIHLPAFVFDHVLQKRFNRDLATCDESEIAAAVSDLEIYVLLLNYISGMRNAGRSPAEFDIFDVENYAAIIERIEGYGPDIAELINRL